MNRNHHIKRNRYTTGKPAHRATSTGTRLNTAQPHRATPSAHHTTGITSDDTLDDLPCLHATHPSDHEQREQAATYAALTVKALNTPLPAAQHADAKALASIAAKQHPELLAGDISIDDEIETLYRAASTWTTRKSCRRALTGAAWCLLKGKPVLFDLRHATGHPSHWQPRNAHGRFLPIHPASLRKRNINKQQHAKLAAAAAHAHEHLKRQVTAA